VKVDEYKPIPYTNDIYHGDKKYFFEKEIGKGGFGVVYLYQEK
jgi:hypothetical protein